MDPKMDSGFLAEGESPGDTFDVLTELLPEEVVGLMDQMLRHEVRPVLPWLMILIGSSISDADLRFHRWHGTWAIHSQQQSSHLTTSTVCFGLNRRHWKMLASTGMGNRVEKTDCCILYSGHTAWP